jgi:hypothetical protein
MKLVKIIWVVWLLRWFKVRLLEFRTLVLSLPIKKQHMQTKKKYIKINFIYTTLNIESYWNDPMWLLKIILYLAIYYKLKIIVLETPGKFYKHF